MQIANNNRLPKLTAALKITNCLKIILQWIASHCGIEGNGQADRMAKLGAEARQDENKVSLTEMKTIIKALHRPP